MVIYKIYMRCHLGSSLHLRFECTAIPLIFHTVPATTEAFIITGRSVCVTQWRHHICCFISCLVTIVSNFGISFKSVASRLCISTGRRLIMIADEFSCYNEIVINCFVLELCDM